MKWHWSKHFEFGLRNVLKLPTQKKVNFWVFANHPTVHSGEGPWLWLLALVTCVR